MAKFRLRLITPNNDKLYTRNSLNQEETFLASTITDFDDQRTVYNDHKENYQQLTTPHPTDPTVAMFSTNSYSYNEKISLHKNGQKELSFNIDDKIFSNNEWIENPFARLLRVGTQLEVTDKYDNCLLFTVNKVDYAFNNLNIVYTINCQDSFTYQLTRQNQGYTLKNDEQDRDFIGALDIDHWTDYIIKDCYITYRYVPLCDGIFQDNDGFLNTFGPYNSNVANNLNTTLANVRKIIKPMYNTTDYAEFYESFPFSASGSNALAALIALGETLGLQLNVIEGWKKIDAHKPIEYVRLFYFGPTKNPDSSGLSYSPSRNVQNFSLNFAGDSLTTVLNVKSTTVDDEEIGIFPAMPAFFMNQILTGELWNNSKYYPGYFIDLITGQRFNEDSICATSTWDQIPEGTNDYITYFEINKNVLSFWPTYYNQIAFRWDKEHITEISSNGYFLPTQYEMGVMVKNFVSQNNYSIYNLILNRNNSYDWSIGTVYELNSSITFNRSFSTYSFQFDMPMSGDYTWPYVVHVFNYNSKNYIQIYKRDSIGGEYINSTFTADIIDFFRTHENEYIVPEEYWDVTTEPYQLYPEYTDIPLEILNKFNNNNNFKLYFYIRHTPEFTAPPVVQQTFIILTRNITTEEQTFAQIAEECPWLENKLIDFSYFYKIGIISKAEYENLTRLIMDDLRIINGQLMCYATSYYESLHKQVDAIAQLQAATDKIGAIFYADIVEPFAKTGNSSLNLGNFIAQYNQLFDFTKDSERKVSLLSLNNIISDYFNKFFQAEQRFLKNIYNFRKFFEDRNIYSTAGETHLQTVQYSIDFDGSVPHNQKVGFNNILEFERITQSSRGIEIKNNQYVATQDVFEWKNNHYILKKLPTWDNYKEFYVPKIIADEAVDITKSIQYNPQNVYFLEETQFNNILGSDSSLERITVTKIIDEQPIEFTYVKLKYIHLLKLFLYCNPNKYYVRDTEQKVPFEWVRCNSETVQAACSIHLWPGLETLYKYAYSVLPWDVDNLTSSLYNTFWPYYRALLPVQKLYVQDFNFHLRQGASQGNDIWEILDENDYPYSYYWDQELEDGWWFQYNPRTKTYDKEISDPNKLYRPFFEVPFLNFKGNLSNIFSENNTSQMSIYDLFNVGNSLASWTQNADFYTKTKNFDWNAFSSGKQQALTKNSLPSGFGLVTPWVINLARTEKTEYSLLQYQGNNRWGDNIHNQSAPSTWNLGSEAHYKGDSRYVNYMTSANAESEIIDLTRSLLSSVDFNNLYPGSSKTYNYKHYVNYYSKIIATYSTGSFPDHLKELDLKDNYLSSENNNYANIDTYTRYANWSFTWDKDIDLFWTDNQYARFCKLDTIINGSDKYLWVKAGSGTYASQTWKPFVYCEDQEIIDENNETTTIHVPIVGERFSAIKFYPLVNGKDQIDLSSLFTSEELTQNDITIGDMLNRLMEQNGGSYFSVEDNPYIISLKIGDTVSYYYILHSEPYEKGIINTNNTKFFNPNKYDINYQDITLSTDIYSIETDNLLEDIIIDVTNLDFMTIPPKDDNLVLVGSLDNTEAEAYWNEVNTHWYETQDISSRTYTLTQSFSSACPAKYYFIKNKVIETSELVRSDWTKVIKDFNIFLHTWDTSTDKILLLNNKTQSYSITCNFIKSASTPNVSTFIVAIEGQNIKITRRIVDSSNIGTLSNGEFWYRFHQDMMHPDLMEKTILIETTLTQYWNQAHTASQYCQWFLPDDWQPSSENHNNYFNKLLYSMNGSKNLVLSNILLPKVELYQIDGKTKLPAYIYWYGNNNKSTCFVETSEYLKNNPAVLQSIKHIFAEEGNLSSQVLQNFTAQENGWTTYYYRQEGGILYKDVPHLLNNKEAIYPKFDGLYPMQLTILLNKYIQTAPTSYEKTLESKLLFWRSLYARFPGIFLENVYENKDARDSKQLLKMAQLAFKDYVSPEKQYNITLIDVESLEGYEGQELHVGDGILLKASDYYDAVDETYRALNQYLFISDISYSLRQDTDIALTVNIIKYQDKLLQSIVKLIR